MNYPILQSMFLQPSGAVYIVGSSAEVSNVPIGSGVTLALCPSESLLYIKLYQDNSPIIQAYSLTPYDTKSRERELEQTVESLTKKVQELQIKLEKEGNLSEFI